MVFDVQLSLDLELLYCVIMVKNDGTNIHD